MRAGSLIGPSRLSPQIHLSAIIAFACYAVGAAICVLASPATLADLLAGGTGPYVQLFAMAAFIVVVAALQRHMGISLRASQTKTPGELCTTGPFKYTRNPIYLAFIIPLAALGYFSVWAAAISIGLYVLAITTFVLRNEERDFEASSARRSKPIAAARRVGFHLGSRRVLEPAQSWRR